VLSNNDCPGDTDGSIDASVSGGTPPYTYQWDDASGQTTPNATGLAAGIYSVTITDNQACTITTTEEITSPTAFMTSTTVLNNVLCNGESTGQALVSITGGTPDYTYLWDSGEMTATASLLDAGTHFVTITDQLGCITIEQVDITEPLALALMVVEDQGLACAGDQNGIATVTPMGGTGLYTFEWDNGESTSTTTGLDGGIHVVTVTDENACIITGQVAISEPAPLDLQVGLDEGVSCNGFTDGQATATINGGNGTYTFLWDNGETEASATALSGGLHDVTVTDIQGCNTVETIDIPEPAALSGTFNLLQSVQCFGEMNGSVELTAGGGTNPYTFNWSNGETTAIATGLSAGINTVTLTDGNGCTLEDQFDVPAPADVLSLSLTALTAVNCFGEDDGSAIATVGGGTLPYTFLWDNGETDILATQLSAGPHDLTLTDANACATTANVLIDGPTAPISLQTTLISEITCFGFNNGQASVNANGGTPPFTYEWSNGNTNSIADDLSVGTQTITVTDANACTEIANVAINGPAELQIAVLAVENVSCRDFADGLIATQGLGGTEPYTYEWSNGLSDASINNLPEGNYSLSLTDNNGCFTSQDFTITQPNNPLNIELSDIIDILCFGDENGQATVTPNGGEAPYQYTWDSGETSQTASLLSAGRHTVTVIDDVGCTVVIDTVDIGGPAAPLTAQLSFEEPTCFGATDGLLRIENGAGGTGPYIYSLDGQLFGPDSLFAGLGSGTYRPVVQDANGCELQLDTFLTEPFEILVFVDPETSLISLGESVDLTSQVNTTAPVAYFWSPADGLSCVDCPAPNAMPLASTVYTLEVVDSSGCSASTEASIEVDINRGVYFPNAFSPNNDGVNDLFQVYGDNSVTIVRELRIFDRWGELLFTANDFQPDDPTFGWDGTMKGQELNPGVYVYFAEVEFIDGVVVPISGDVTLIR
ncbi:MAG: gliding motility-associated C-terminal domain-containing protein, partial [Bacteroidota bacterium]